MNSADKCQGFPESCKISFRRILIGSPESKSRGASSRASRLRRAWGFEGEFRQWEDLLWIGELRLLASRKVVQTNYRDEQDSLGLCLRPLIARPSRGSRLTTIRDGEQIEPMDEKRLPIDYLFRVREDLDMILQRKPKAPDLIYDACEAALPHVCAAIGHLDSTPPNQNDRRNEQPLRNFEEMFKLPKERANDLHYKISEWLDGRSRNERIAREVLRLIRNDLREAQGADDFVGLEIDEALRDICCAIGRLIP